MQRDLHMPLLAAMQGYLAEQVTPFHTRGIKPAKALTKYCCNSWGRRRCHWI
jgi:hypothetical protein